MEKKVMGKNYVVGVPGEEYIVKFILHRDANFSYPYKLLKVGLYVDGQDVNYWKRIDTTAMSNINDEVATIFWGFKKNTNDIRAFVFAKPPKINHQMSQQQLSKLQPLGQIRIVVFEAKLADGIFHNQTFCQDISNPSYNHPSDEKLLSQPSITTRAGRKIDASKETFAPLQKWINCSSEPVETIIMPYHSSEMISLLLSIGRDENQSHDKHFTSVQSFDSSSDDITNKKRSISSDSLSSNHVKSVNGKRPCFNDNDSSASIRSGATETETASTLKPGLREETEGDICYVPIVKEVPFIDLSDETKPAKWTNIRQIK
eukprot:CAMPEP_0182430514 /NCGR_PEP_ID=MMETSP1167-20130531/41281_1 /TAXON_ID=2988 /ORGANISM="Mallomonas Sp, Strain CCMP3275" /LENGTH=316 /DNA_ID=CAMNT_0024615711 /DNA_START=151 /DNA_END=1101 /DNA_ORIENTATION=+